MSKKAVSSFFTMAQLLGNGHAFRLPKSTKAKVDVQYYELLSVTPSGKYGWFRTNVGCIKKPIRFKEQIVKETTDED